MSNEGDNTTCRCSNIHLSKVTNKFAVQREQIEGLAVFSRCHDKLEILKSLDEMRGLK